MVSRRTRVASWIFRRDHPSRPKAMICCFFSSFKTFAMLREATYPPAAVNVLDVSSESMAAFQVFLYGRFWVFTEGSALPLGVHHEYPHSSLDLVYGCCRFPVSWKHAIHHQRYHPWFNYRSGRRSSARDHVHSQS